MIDINELYKRLYSATSTEEALDQAAGLYQEAASYIDALREFQGECKERLTEIFVETGVTEVETSSARCYVTRPSIRVTYDRKGLDALIEHDDDLAVLLEPYRKVTQVPGTLTIRRKRQ